jgi:hypothetical protein
MTCGSGSRRQNTARQAASSRVGYAVAMVEIITTHDPSVAPHKSGEDVLYLMRDSDDPDGPVLAFTAAEWEAFVAGVKDGEFDLAEDEPAG